MLLALENPPFVVPAELHVWNLWLVSGPAIFIYREDSGGYMTCISCETHGSQPSCLHHVFALEPLIYGFTVRPSIGIDWFLTGYSLQVIVSIFQYGWSMIITIICSFCCRTMWKWRKHQTSPNIIKRHQTSTNIINHQLVPMKDWHFFAFNIHAAGS